MPAAIGNLATHDRVSGKMEAALDSRHKSILEFIWQSIVDPFQRWRRMVQAAAEMG
ncbi:hypothetical protein [Nitrosomonas sp.]|uniref:hypothetical protein n=1 Tax=Nitrosomonas sp. TaxID=42353 RepID=UPI003306288A